MGKVLSKPLLLAILVGIVLIMLLWGISTSRVIRNFGKVQWYVNEMSPSFFNTKRPPLVNAEYVTIAGKRHEMSELTMLDRFILRITWTKGPIQVF